MKKILIIFITFLVASTALYGCHEASAAAEKTQVVNTVVNDGYNSAKVNKVTIEGHDYYYAIYQGYKSGGISIIHSEACKCKK